MQTNSGKSSLEERVGYSLGDTASNLFFPTFILFLLYFYTDVFGLSAAAVGTMFLVTRIWDAFFDPIVGTISDRTHTRWGKFRPSLLWFALPFGIIIMLLSVYPAALGGVGGLLMLFCPATRKMIIKIEEDMTARRGWAPAEAVAAGLGGMNSSGKSSAHLLRTVCCGSSHREAANRNKEVFL